MLFRSRGGVIRRLVGRAVAAEFKDEIAAALGDHQHGVAKDGAARLHRRVCAYVHGDAGRLIVAVDLADAFSTASRAALVEACRRLLPELAPLVETWYGEPTLHWAPPQDGESEGPWLEQLLGVDQGCPLSPALWSLLPALIREHVLEVMRAIDPTARLEAFLDDHYLAGSEAAVKAGVQEFEQMFRAVGILLRHTKTKVWAPGRADKLGGDLETYRVTSLTVVGTAVAYLRGGEEDTEETRVVAGRVGLNLELDRDQGGACCAQTDPLP